MIQLLSVLLAAAAIAGSAVAASTSAPSAAPRLPGVSPTMPGGPPALPPSPPPPGAMPASFDVGVWTIHASSIDANFKSGDFSTPAKVVMTRIGGDVTADRANGNYKKQVLFLTGHVVMHDSQGSAGAIAGGSSAHASSPSTLTADKAQIDGKAKLYKAIGNVHYVQADTVVDADNGTLDDETHDLLLEGKVRIVQGARSMRAQRIVYNTQTGKAHAQGDVTMQFPSELHRTLATPKPLHMPKNGLTAPDTAPTP